jgi:hypothetical protein
MQSQANFGNGLLWWGELPREPGLMEFAIKIGLPVVSPHRFSLN